MNATSFSDLPDPPKPASDAVSGFAWVVVGVLLPVALLNYLDRQMLAAMKSSMMRDIPDIQNEANWGQILAWFKWVYAVLSPLGGYIADRVSKRQVVVISLGVWSAVTFITGYVETFPQLVVARALMGIAEAFYIPAALAMISEFHVGSTRSRAVGLHQMGIYAGIILGGFSGYVADNPALGWRWAFVWCGVIGVVYAFPLFTILRDPPRRESSQQASGVGDTAWQLFTNLNFILLVLYFTLPAMAGWVVKDWMPSILNEKFNLGQGLSGVSAVVYVHPASIVGVGIGGWLADRWMTLTLRGRIYVSALGMSCFIPSLFGVGFATSLPLAIVFLILFGLGWGFFDCNNMPILCQIVKPEHRATGYGIMNLVSISCGGFADWGFGYLRDRQVPLAMIFGVFAGVAALSILIVLLIRPNPQLSAEAGGK